MTVTKQQQLEWLAKECHIWKGRDFILVSDTELGYRLPVTAGCHLITSEEWQQERDKMSGKPEVDNSWHERGELPPVGRECLSPGGEIVMIASHGSISGVPVAFYPFGVGGLYSAACAKQFRPLRTEREKAIDEMVSGYQSAKGDKPVHPRVRVFAEYLYDAGYRKVKP